MPAGSAMTSTSARQARCINQASIAPGPNKSPAGGTGLSSSNGPAWRGLRERQQARHHNAEPQSWLRGADHRKSPAR